MKLLSADHLLPISSEPLDQGAILIEDGIIAAVGPLNRLAGDHPEAKAEHFPGAVILPGFINCHSHLELTFLRGCLDHLDHDFYAWLLKLTEIRAEQLSEHDIQLSAMLGALEGASAGVTCFGDIGRNGSAALKALQSIGLRGVVFQETGFSPADISAANDFERLWRKVERLDGLSTPLIEVGISPHSPYTVSRKLFELICEAASSEGRKITIHAAESEAEQGLMLRGEGFFAKLYDDLGIDFEPPGCTSLEYLERIGVLNSKPILAHCTKASDRDIELIAESGSAVAHCPKSNAKFGHGIAPLGGFLERSVPVGLGTDSMASNNVCDIIEEARSAVLSARVHPGHRRFLHPSDAIRMATLGGAEALGIDEIVGSLETGKAADVSVINISGTSHLPVHDVYSAILFASSARDVLMTMVAGREIYRAGTFSGIDDGEIRAAAAEFASRMR